MIHSVEHPTLDLEVVSSSPMLSVDYLKNFVWSWNPSCVEPIISLRITILWILLENRGLDIDALFSGEPGNQTESRDPSGKYQNPCGYSKKQTILQIGLGVLGGAEALGNGPSL